MKEKDLENKVSLLKPQQLGKRTGCDGLLTQSQQLYTEDLTLALVQPAEWGVPG